MMQPPIHSGLDLGNPAILASFCAELDVSEDELRLAVLAVGSMPEALKFYFRSKRPAPRKS